jgi:hypothetical protein
MKNTLLQLTSLVAIFAIGCIHSCKKDSAVTLPATAPADPVISTSFIEEFADVPALYLKGWISEAQGASQSYAVYWNQGAPPSADKSGSSYGFPAYSYYVNKDEYIFSGDNPDGSFSSWLITPVTSVKNGDKISFYAYGDDDGRCRLQVLMSQSESYTIGDTLNSIGNFSVLLNIPAQPFAGAFASVWTKYEYTFSGISGNMKTRIAFRHYTESQTLPGGPATGIGIDQFKFEVSN